jgi:hypothetical protein
LNVPEGTANLYKAANVWKDFYIVESAVFIPVTNITGVPTATMAGTPLALTGTIVPDSATNKTINWSIKDAGTTGAGISTSVDYVYVDGVLTPVTNIALVTSAAGTVIVTATVKDGAAAGTDYTQDFSITVTAAANPDLEAVNAVKALIEAGTYTVAQATANDEATVNSWLVEQINALPGMSDTGITISESDITLNSFTAAVTDATDGSFSFTVSLAKGNSQAAASKDGTITFSTSFVPVTNISGVPASMKVGESIGFDGTYTIYQSLSIAGIAVNAIVDPDNATNQKILWSIKDTGTTDINTSQEVDYVYINGILTPLTYIALTPQAQGSIILTATIKDGIAKGVDYTQDFTITVTAEVIPPALSVSPDALGFTADGGEQTITIASNVDWTVTGSNGSKSWLTISPASGSNDGTVTVTVDVNKSAAQRTATITVSGSGVTAQTIGITQAPKKDTPSVVPNGNGNGNNGKGKGTIELNLSIPVDATLTGSFEIQFPDGMTLDEELTALSTGLPGSFNLAFSYEGNNTWLITIASNTMRSAQAEEYQNIMDIVYTVADSIPQGEYEVTIMNLDFTMSDGTPIQADLLTVPISVERTVTSIENIDNKSFYAYCNNNLLMIESSHAESITVYSVAGVELYAGKKNVGMTEIPLSSLRGSIFIIKGSVSGTIKIIEN